MSCNTIDVNAVNKRTLENKNNKSMENLLFIDTETTGTGAEDRMYQVAYKYGEEIINEFFKPELPIKPGAMAITHVTNEMVAEKPQFDGSRTKVHLLDLSAKDAIFIAHNAKFDLDMLIKEGIEFKRFIDTMKVARAIDREGKLDNYQLQYLRYYYELDIDLGDLSPHDALADIIVLEQVTYHLASELCKLEGIKYEDAFTRMIEISTKPNLLHICKFNKHAGKTWEWVARNEMGYINYFDDKDVDADVRYTMDYWKNKLA